MSAPAVLRVPVPGAAVTAVLLRVAVGSGLERTGERGVAHALEHLVVRSSLRGLPVAAATGRDATTYTLLVRPDRTEAAVRDLLRALDDLTVDPDVLAGEVAAIRQERAQREHEVAWAVQQALLARLWAGTAHAHPTLGDPEVVDRLTPRCAGRYHRRWYRPEHALVVVAGDDVAEPGTPVPRSRGNRPPAAGDGDRAAVVEVRLPGRPVAHGVGWATPGDPPEPTVATALAGRVLRQATGLVTTSLRMGDRRLTWAVLSGAGSAAHAVEHVLRAVDGTLDLLGDPGAFAALVSAARIRELRDADDVPAVAVRAAEEWWHHGTATSPDARAGAVVGTGPADLAAELARWRSGWAGLR
ncbi:M16 family metallopeptidase [Geodermatophilus sp. SYSU D00705]